MSDNHAWKLVAPWYRWGKQQSEEKLAPRATHPVFQKYETGDLVNAFLKDPQRSLQFLDEDRVVELLPVETVFMGGKLRRKLFAEKRAVPGKTRKLFLDTHRRFYLIVCELHCDAPGFPSVNREQVCEAGFVVRRRRVIAPEGRLAERAKIAKERRLASEQIVKLAAAERSVKGAPGSIRLQRRREELHSDLQRRMAELAGAMKAADAAQRKLEEPFHGMRLLEGWVPSGLDGIGSWKAVDEEPQAIEERIYPLSPLIADPRDPTHAGIGCTIYFGLLPTGAADTDDEGNALFDELSEYEARCFVRQHREGCEKKVTRADCPGSLWWSAPTEIYRIAAHFDLIGTSNRPVTMQLPALGELRAQAATLPPTKISPFRVAAPDAESNLGIDVVVENGVVKEVKKGTPTKEICSFSIPLITIVVTFVFKLFLPVVMFIFQLWFMLKLKFCIPPSFEAGGGAKAALDVIPPEIDADIGLEVKLDAGAKAALNTELARDLGGAVTGDLTMNVHKALKKDLVKKGKDAGVTDAYFDDYSNEALLALETDLTTDFAQDKNAASLSASLQLEPRVSREEAKVS